MTREEGGEGPGRRRFLKLAAVAGAGVVLPALVVVAHGTHGPAESGNPARNTLIAYVTRTGNTKAVAEIIRQATGGALVEVAMATPYPENYAAIVAQVQRENETDYLPPLEATVTNLRDYDTVFLGFPTWGMQLPPPMKSFLHAHDLRGKTLVPFNTHGGYGVGSGFQEVESLCPGANVVQGFSTRGGLERDGILLGIEGRRKDSVHAEVTQWLQRIGVRVAVG